MILGLLNYRADFATDAKVAAPKTTLVEVGTLKSRYGEVGKWAGLAFEGKYHLLRDLEGEAEETALAVEASSRSSEDVIQIRREKAAATTERTMAAVQKTDKQLELQRLRLETAKVKAEARTKRVATAPEDEGETA